MHLGGQQGLNAQAGPAGVGVGSWEGKQFFPETQAEPERSQKREWVCDGGRDRM